MTHTFSTWNSYTAERDEYTTVLVIDDIEYVLSHNAKYVKGEFGTMIRLIAKVDNVLILDRATYNYGRGYGAEFRSLQDAKNHAQQVAERYALAMHKAL